MDITVSGRCKNISKKQLIHAAEFFISRLFTKRMAKNISIYIELKNSKKFGLKGSCGIIDDFKRPRMFKINIGDKQTRANILKTLAHELVHAKQYTYGEMKVYFSHQLTRWGDQLIDEDIGNYWEYPWEIEAYGREVGLFVMYKQHVKHSGLKFK